MNELDMLLGAWRVADAAFGGIWPLTSRLAEKDEELHTAARAAQTSWAALERCITARRLARDNIAKVLKK